MDYRYGYRTTFTGTTRGNPPVFHVYIKGNVRRGLCGVSLDGQPQPHLYAGQLCQKCRSIAAKRGLGEVDKLTQEEAS